ncbi:hypothetical protein VNO77_20471 [Canavalia gladiata]|uniref:Uncharacterized protein n=1 Tax=Canavalia gladiata TaxID=3824 RepID=A0AAN9LTL3_CANGL
MLTWGHFRITEQVPIFLLNCALEFIALEPAAAGPFMDNYGWRYPVNDQISIYPTPDYSPRIRTPNLIPALDHGDPVLSANSSVHLLADIGTSIDNLDFGFFLILCYQHKYVTRLDIEADRAMTKFLGPHQVQCDQALILYYLGQYHCLDLYLPLVIMFGRLMLTCTVEIWLDGVREGCHHPIHLPILNIPSIALIDGFGTIFTAK